MKQENTLTIIRNAVEKYIESDKYNYKLYTAIFNALKPHDGKKINKRFESYVQKELGEGFDVYFKQEYSMFYICIRRKGESSRDYKEVLIGYTQNPIFRLLSGDKNASVNGLYSERGFDYFGAPWGSAALERIKKNEKILKSNKLEKLALAFDEKKRLEKEIEKLNLDSYDFPAKYAVDKALSGEKQQNN